MPLARRMEEPREPREPMRLRVVESPPQGAWLRPDWSRPLERVALETVVGSALGSALGMKWGGLQTGPRAPALPSEGLLARVRAHARSLAIDLRYPA